MFLTVLGVILGFLAFMFCLFLLAEAADRIADWAWDKFSDWFLRDRGES